MVDPRINTDIYSCTNLCRYYDSFQYVEDRVNDLDFGFCKKGHSINLNSNLVGTCISQAYGTSISYNSCHTDYLNSFIPSFVSPSGSGQIPKIISVNETVNPITIYEHINDELILEIDNYKKWITIPFGLDLIPEVVADNIKHTVRNESGIDSFVDVMCDYVNNRFEIYSPSASVIKLHKEGSINSILGFSTIVDTVNSGTVDSNTGTGELYFPVLDKSIKFYTTASEYDLSIYRDIPQTTKGILTFDFYLESIGRVNVQMGDSTNKILHMNLSNANSINIYKDISTISGSFWLEFSSSFSDGPDPLDYEDTTYDFNLRLIGTFDTNLFSTTFSERRWVIEDIADARNNHYVNTDVDWNRIDFTYHRDAGFGNFYAQGDLAAGLFSPPYYVPETDPHDEWFPFPTGLNFEKISFDLSGCNSNAYIDGIKIYELNDNYLIPDDISTITIGTVPSGWDVTPSGSATVEYKPVVGGKCVELSGELAYIERSFTGIDATRFGFRFRTSSNSENHEISLLSTAADSVKLNFADDGYIKKYDFATSSFTNLNGTTGYVSYEADKWYYLEIMAEYDSPDCTYNVCVFNNYDIGATCSGYMYANKGYGLTGSGVGNFNKIKFEHPASTTGTSYLKDILVEDLDFSNDTVFTETFESDTIGELPANWTTVISTSDGSLVEIAANPAGAGKCVKIEDDSSSYNTATNMVRNFISVSAGVKKYRVKYDVYRGGPSFYAGYDYLSVYSSINEELFRVAANNSRGAFVSDISYYVDSSNKYMETNWTNEYPSSIGIDEWKTRDIIFDLEYPKFSLYHEGKMLGRREVFNQHADSLGTDAFLKITSRSTTAALAGIAYFDNFYVCGVADLINEDFNSYSTGSNLSGTSWTLISGSVVFNPEELGAKSIKLVDDSVDYYSTSGHSFIKRSFDEAGYIHISFDVFPMNDSTWRVTWGQGATRIGEIRMLDREGSNRTGTVAEICDDTSGYSNEPDGRVYRVVYRSRYDDEFSGVEDAFKRRLQVRPWEFLHFDIYSCIARDITRTSVLVNGNFVDCWFDSVAAWNRLNFYDNLSGFDYVEISTDSSAVSGVRKRLYADSLKNTLYISDFSVTTEEKGSILFSETFEGNEGQSPVGWVGSNSDGTSQLEVMPEDRTSSLSVSFDTDGIYEIPYLDYINTLGGNPYESTWHTFKLDFDCDDETYDIYLNDSIISTSLNLFTVNNYLDFIKIKADTFNPDNNFRIDNISMVTDDGITVFDEDNNSVNYVVDSLPFNWTTQETGGTVRVYQETPEENVIFYNSLDDDVYTVTFVHGGNTLRIWNDDYDVVYAYISFSTLSYVDISFDIFIRKDVSGSSSYFKLRNNNSDVVNIRFNNNAKLVEFYDGSSWNSFFYYFKWKAHQWYNIRIVANLVYPVIVSVYIDSVFVDNITTTESIDLVNRLYFTTQDSIKTDFYIDNIIIKNSIGSTIYSSNFSSDSLLGIPTGWTCSPGSYLDQSPKYELSGTFINNAVLVSGSYSGAVPKISGDRLGINPNNFYITFNTSMSNQPNVSGKGLYFTVSDDQNESFSSTVSVSRYNNFYRITKPYSGYGHVYISIPNDAVFVSDVVFKVRCDSINTLTDTAPGSTSFIYSSIKGDNSNVAFDTEADYSSLYTLGNKGMKFGLYDDQTYNDGDRFKIYTKSTWPVEVSVGVDYATGSIKRGFKSDIKALRFKLESAPVTSTLYKEAGFSVISWELGPEGYTDIKYAFSDEWPYILLSYDDFEDDRLGLTTNSWVPVPSGISSEIFKNSDEVLTNDFYSNMIYYYIELDKYGGGLNTITTRFYYEV